MLKDNKFIEKISELMFKLGQNNILQAISGGMMMTMAISLGAAIFSLLGNFPVSSVATFFSEVGLTPHFQAVYNGSMGILSVVVVITVAFNYAKSLNVNQGTAILFALAGFFILIPQTVGEGDAVISAFSASLLGSSGLFMAMLLGILMPLLYAKLSKGGKLNFKLPDSVPPMVSQSLAPVFIGIIILTILFILRVGFAYTPFNDAFNFINTVVGAPITSIGGSVVGFLIVATLMPLLFFFGIHPSAVAAAFSPVRTPIILGAIESFNNGEVVENSAELITYFFSQIDATGNTLGFLIAILIVSKSVRYKNMTKLSIAPNVFNINEPVIFGFPIVLNPTLFIPFVLSPLVSGLIGLVAFNIGFISSVTPPAFFLPWTTPKVITAFVLAGWQGAVVWIICLVAMIALYLPFVKMLDKRELDVEQNTN